MFTNGPLQKSNGNGKNKHVFEHLKNAQFTPEQKAKFCYDQGICPTCGVKTHWIGPFKRRPYTNDQVDNGVCIACNPDRFPPQHLTAAAAESSLPNWNWRQAPADGLFSRTSGAFSTFSENVNNTVTSISKSTSETLNTATQHAQKTAEQARNQAQKTAQQARNQAQKTAQQARTAGFPQFPFSSNQKQQAQSNSETPKTPFSSLQTTFSTDEEKERQKSDDKKLLKKTSSIGVKEEIVGKNVTTAYGPGKVLGYRSEDDIFEVELSTSNSHGNENKETKLFCKMDSFSIDHGNVKTHKRAMELNEAYEAMEKMRRLNLEVECGDRNIEVDFNKCTMCLLGSGDENSTGEGQQEQNFPRIRKFMKENQRKKPPEPCLFCANPCCRDHSSVEFRKEGIVACNDCVKIFEPDYIVNCINSAHGLEEEINEEMNDDKARERKVDHLIDLYDRVLLLLQYSSQYIDPLAEALEESKKKANTANMTGSSAGIVSGALGVAAAATLLTPAGAPLLVASLVLGGSATAVQTGTELGVQYFSEPHKVAGRLIALYGMLHNLLRVKETLREALTARLIDLKHHDDIKVFKGRLEEIENKRKETAVKLGTRVGGTALIGSFAGAAVGAETAAMMTSVEMGGMNYVTKASTGLARGARFARGFGGALCAATILLEARTMSTTMEQIRAGNPCDKANTLRTISKELPTLPSTKDIDEECQVYLGAMSNRVNAPSLEDAMQLIESKAIADWQIARAKEEEETKDSHVGTEIAPVGANIMEGEEDLNDDLALWESTLKDRKLAQSLSELPANHEERRDELSAKSAPPRMAQSMMSMPSESASSPMSHSSLLERIQKFKEQDQSGACSD